VVEVSQGEIWRADLPEPTGSGREFRSVVVVQGSAIRRARNYSALPAGLPDKCWDSGNCESVKRSFSWEVERKYEVGYH